VASDQIILEIIKNNVENTESKRFLDLNCDTGRLAFEAAQTFKEVTAIDFSARFIRPAIELQKRGFLRYVIKDEGELQIFKDVLLEDLGLQNNTERILFMQDDAMKLKERFNDYDVIVAFNLLEEMSNPAVFLSQIHTRLKTNGLLILGSTYEWNESICKKLNWLGGFKKDGEPVKSFDGLSDILSNYFILHNNPLEVKYLKRKSSRIFQVLISELSIWRKK